MTGVVAFLQKMIRLKLDDNRRHLPLPQGIYPVGCLDIMTEYSSSGCLMRLYYPCSQDDAKDRAMQWPLWLPMKEYLNGYAKFLGMWAFLFRLLFRLVVGDIYIPAAWKAMPIKGMTFPVIVFSHGLGGCRTSYSTVCAELASHGFIVAAVEHRDHTACLSFYMKDIRNGHLSDQVDISNSNLTSADITVNAVTEWVSYQKIRKPRKEYPIRNRQVYQRSRECTKALDLILALNRGDRVTNLIDANFTSSWFQGIFDASRVGMIGHSLGGVSIVPTLASDKRFKVGVALDAWMFPVREEDGIFSSVNQPVYFINMEKFQTVKNLSIMKRLASESVDRRMVTIRGTIHQNAADTPFLAGRLMRLFFGANSPIDRFLAMDLINRLTLEFLWKHLDIPRDVKYTMLLDTYKDILDEEGLLF